MEPHSFADVAKTPSSSLEEPSIKAQSPAVTMITQLGTLRPINSLTDFFGNDTSRRKVQSDKERQQLVWLAIHAGRYHERYYQEHPTSEAMLPTILPYIDTNVDVASLLVSNRGPTEILIEISIDPILFFFSLQCFHAEIEALMVAMGCCLDVTTALSSPTGRPVHLHGPSRIVAERCASMFMRILSQIVVVAHPQSNLEGETLPHGVHTQNWLYIRAIDLPKLTFKPSIIRVVQPLDSRELLCGKKDGKLIRIQKEHQVKIAVKEDPAEEEKYFFWVVIQDANDVKQLASALQALEDEVPTDHSFHLDSQQHRRLIGNRGATIQKVMRAYGVYIRFLSDQEALETLGEEDRLTIGSPINNVLIKTPKKNRQVFGKAQRDLLEQAGQHMPTVTDYSVPVDGTFRVRVAAQLRYRRLDSGVVPTGFGAEQDIKLVDSYEDLLHSLPRNVQDIKMKSNDDLTFAMKPSNATLRRKRSLSLGLDIGRMDFSSQWNVDDFQWRSRRGTI